MRSITRGLSLFGIFAAGITVGIAAGEYDMSARQEMKRTDLSGAPGMEVIASVSEYKKGDFIPLHSHHGVEAGYVLQGTTVQAAGKDPIKLETGAPIMNLRDVPHAGFKVVGDESFKVFTVHIVDKGKPLYEWVR